MADTIPLIFDTDIGSDIDDAVALAYLLRQPRCELLGITTVTGDVARRAACAQVLCDAAGRTNVPIHCGAGDVLLNGPGQPNVPQFSAIEALAKKKDWEKNTAIDFMRKTIHARPGEITLLSVGPFTNVALLFAIDREIPRLLKQVVSMAGIFFGKPDQREWNCFVDPVATAIAYKTAVRKHVSIGLDVTMQVQMDAAQVREKFKGKLLETVAKMAEVWFKNARRMVFHDPLATVSVFRPEICTYKEGLVQISINADEKKAGHTLFKEQQGGRHAVAATVDAAAFFAEYFAVAGQA